MVQGIGWREKKNLPKTGFMGINVTCMKAKSFIGVKEESSCARGLLTDKQHTQRNVLIEALRGKT